MSVPVQIVSPAANKPSIAFVQDSIIGSFLLTQPNTVVLRAEALTLHASIEGPCQPLPRQQSYEGRELFSLLFPVEFQYRNARAGVVIRDGILIEGALCKITLGATSGGIIHSMFHAFGPARTAAFISDTQRLVNRWLLRHGFSIKLADCEASAETTEQVQMLIRLADQKVQRILEAKPALPPERVEATLAEIANRVLTNVGKVVHASLDSKSNALYQAVLSASKGNLINVAQLLGCIGQTSVEGQRIFASDPQKQFGEPGTLAKCGFCRSSYFEGLSSTEFYALVLASDRDTQAPRRPRVSRLSRGVQTAQRRPSARRVYFHTMAGREGLQAPGRNRRVAPERFASLTGDSCPHACN